MAAGSVAAKNRGLPSYCCELLIKNQWSNDLRAGILLIPPPVIDERKKS
jgi:hypothetical protein